MGATWPHPTTSGMSRLAQAERFHFVFVQAEVVAEFVQEGGGDFFAKVPGVFQQPARFQRPVKDGRQKMKTPDF